MLLSCVCESSVVSAPLRLRQPLPTVIHLNSVSSFWGINLALSYRIDIVVSETVVVEVKAVDKVLPIHEAQLLTYLKLGGYQIGLLLNFNVAQLRDGIVRKVLGLQEE